VQCDGVGCFVGGGGGGGEWEGIISPDIIHTVVVLYVLDCCCVIIVYIIYFVFYLFDCIYCIVFYFYFMQPYLVVYNNLHVPLMLPYHYDQDQNLQILETYQDQHLDVFLNIVFYIFQILIY
jgi:hypothetical protein